MAKKKSQKGGRIGRAKKKSVGRMRRSSRNKSKVSRAKKPTLQKGGKVQQAEESAKGPKSGSSKTAKQLGQKVKSLSRSMGSKNAVTKVQRELRKMVREQHNASPASKKKWMARIAAAGKRAIGNKSGRPLIGRSTKKSSVSKSGRSSLRSKKRRK